MNVRLFIAAAALSTLPAIAQQVPPAPATAATPQAAPASKPVALINGEVITQEKLDRLWNRLGTQMRDQYMKAGGKMAYLENYLRKRLMIQEAIKTGFDKRPEIQFELEAAKEAAMFDRYVRDVVSAQIISEEQMRRYYEEHQDNFVIPEKAKVRHIVVSTAGVSGRSREMAMERVQQIAGELRGKTVLPPGTDPEAAARIRLSHFAEAARKYSEDGVAQNGGDLGWVEKGALDPKFEEAAFGMRPGVISGMIETPFGFHLILVEDRKPAGFEEFSDVKESIREFLMTENAAAVMESVNRLTNELRQTSKITLYPENVR